MIKFRCDCGNEDPDCFDVYVAQSDLCGVLYVICRNCGNTREDFVACTGDNIKLTVA